MTKVFFIGAILALGFGPTVYAVLHVFGHVVKAILRMATRKEAGFLVDLLVGAGFGAFFAPDLGPIRYAVAAVAILAAAFVKHYGD